MVLFYCAMFTSILLFVGITCWTNSKNVSSTSGDSCLTSLGMSRPRPPFGRCHQRYQSCTRLLFLVNLLLVGVETNPGPAQFQRNIKVGSLNARSAVLHAADLHLLIVDEALDVLAVCETRVRRDTPDAIASDLAPPGYRVTNAPPADDRRGGGQAFIFRKDMTVVPVTLKLCPTSFDVQVVRINIGTERFLFVNTYRPPRTDINCFLDELSDVVDEVDEVVSLGMHLVILGDFNCPGDAPTEFDSRLEAWLSCYDMSVSTGGPTHLNFDGGLSRLDLIAESGHPRKLSDASVVLTGFSDHRLLTAVLDCTRPPAAVVTYSYRDIRRLDVSAFRNLFSASSSVVSPSDDPNLIAQQLDDDLTAVLDRLAPLRTRTRRCGKPETRWMSDAVVNAKKARRRLERKYSRSRSASD
jgi:hypothetical protein